MTVAGPEVGPSVTGTPGGLEPTAKDSGSPYSSRSVADAVSGREHGADDVNESVAER
jgi:hypothetical protein